MPPRRYVKNIYATDAQASGLLVMASYNWGEHRVIDLLRTMPDEPEGAQLLAAAREAPASRTSPTITSSASSPPRSSARTRGCSAFSSTSPLKFLEQRKGASVRVAPACQRGTLDMRH